jgi:hypothetical protein
LFLPIELPLFLLWGLIVFPPFALALAVAGVASYLGCLPWRLRMWRQRQQLRRQLVPGDRVLAWGEVEARMREEEGTLIVQHCAPRGPVWQWWVSEDLVASAPGPLPTSVYSLPVGANLERLHDLARDVLSRYLDVESGTASLTQCAHDGPWRVHRRQGGLVEQLGGAGATILVPGPIFAGDSVDDWRRLEAAYPTCTVVTALCWGDSPLLLRGDAEQVFPPPRTPAGDRARR